jgi:NADPH:quinone reductase-like Zn-dependent oxidoreductase
LAITTDVDVEMNPSLYINGKKYSLLDPRIEYAALRENETVGVIGSTGGVGDAVVQFAKAHRCARFRNRSSSSLRRRPASHRRRCATRLKGSKPGVYSAIVQPWPWRRCWFNAAGGKMFDGGVRLLGHRGRHVEITAPTERHVILELVDFYRDESQLSGVDSLK